MIGKILVAAAAAGAMAVSMLPVAAQAEPSAEQLAEGKLLFQQNAAPTCATCHTLADADASGTIGPDLDEMKPALEQVLAAVQQGVGIMPSFEDSLSEEQIQAVASYVVSATGGQP